MKILDDVIKYIFIFHRWSYYKQNLQVFINKTFGTFHENYTANDAIKCAPILRIHRTLLLLRRMGCIKLRD